MAGALEAEGAAFRAVFGDERADCGEALERHHAEGPPADWPSAFVSSYATAHRWEDIAESWAHWMHMADALEMASSLEVAVSPRADRTGVPEAAISFGPYAAPDIHGLREAWVPLTYAMNSLNRCMGAPGPFAFGLSARAVTKLGFVPHLLRAARGG